MTIKDQIRTGARSRARTGQAPGMMTVRDANGNVVEVPVNGGIGPACGPMAPTQPQSWGAACPPGICDPSTLAASLGRSFVGERYGCRELTYWLFGEFDAGGQLTFAQNSDLTICPTRIVGWVTDPAGDRVQEGVLSTFTIGAQNQIFGDPLPLSTISPDSYQMVPFVTDCIRAGGPFSLTVTGGTPGNLVYVGLIGPAIG